MKSTPSTHALILVIDDNLSNLSVITDHLDANGFDVMIARDGQDGIDKAQRGHPDLILLDVMMPGIDGFETCRRLKANAPTRSIPILFMTALDSIEDKLKGFDAGGQDYITKPFNEQEALARIHVHISLRRLQLEAQDRNQRLEKANQNLKKALEEIKTLHGILPICAACKKIRDDDGCWSQIEEYIQKHTDADFSHGICPECARKLYPEYDLSGD